MAGNILNVGKSALFAAQAGLTTTGHNIANANVAGYSRQTVVQGTAFGQDLGFGFIGNGTDVSEIKRYSDAFLNGQVRQAQATTSSLNSFYTQISQVDNLMADPTTGLSPALQGFFKSVQDLSSAPTSNVARQGMLSAGESLASRFQGIDARLQELRGNVNAQIGSNVNAINSYSTQIAALNEQISQNSANPGRMPNDLLDARDQLIAELNTHVKTTVVPSERNTVTVSIGSGQPLVVGARAFSLAAVPSATDSSRIEVAYISGGQPQRMADGTIKGGELGGLLEFRSTALDQAQSRLGRVAAGVALSFNAQHGLGLDQAGQAGAAFFKVGAPFVGASETNNPASTTSVKAELVDATKLTQSDYKVQYDGADFVVTRLSDNTQTKIVPYPQTAAQIIDGVAYTITGGASAGDSYSVRPTINGASEFGMAISDRGKIAAAAAVVSEAQLQNTGSGKIGEAVYGSAYMDAPLAAPLKLTFSTPAGGGRQFTATAPVTVTVGGVPTQYAAGELISYSAASGATVSSGGLSVALSGAPDSGDVFTVAAGNGNSSDNRNMRALGALQTAGVFDGGNGTFQSAYAEMVSFVGNKTRETQVKSAASETMLAQARRSQGEVSGVNLDEEAANLLKYQQAYQAAGKLMQASSEMFDTLLSLGS
ncbi:flagellar hook-associated protein FlgK [Massilia glaciei]|uniref:Flagellar hook-associated protein 1 n=1 Tax=Massilia glaciei TaxID=1524097 RepID=A0A2U2HGQ0_9BURK|nr:flagellar hook-associated protein FlgK [Massilia glaciei]PWF44349.1 flagellar hook-associated protein FlgK [Massilia glaciei]